jgi:xanthine dehydrogenase YagR molybdenum-binding subunit
MPRVQQVCRAGCAYRLLQDDRIFYVNQPVAVAETLEAAVEAVERVVVRYEVRKPSISLAAGQENSYVPKKVGGARDPATSHRGDPAGALASAGTKMESYTTPFHTHSPMEPHSTIAVWEGDDKLTLYDTPQGIFGDRKRIAELLGLQRDNVRVVRFLLVGAAGSKGSTLSHGATCAMAARYVKRPVKLVLRRPQMFGPLGCHSETRQTISLGALKDGTLTALTNETLTHTSTMDEFAETASLPTRMLHQVANNSTIQRPVRSDIGAPSYTRAPGEAPSTASLEIAMDELAYKPGVDPVELRLKNYAEQYPDKNLPWSSKSPRECYGQGAERFGWARRSPEPRSMRQGNTLIGLGMATAVYPARRSPAQASTRKNEETKNFSMYSFGAQFSEVHVDADLGQIRVARITGVFAADNNLAEYHVPTNADVGSFDVAWVDEYDRHVSFVGAKDIGEIGITGSAAAVANAVYHATRKRVRDLPITPDKLL